MGIKRTKTIQYNFGDKHKSYIANTANNLYNIAEGAVRSGKTTDNIFAFAHELKHTPDRLHLATGSTEANAKLNIGDCNGFGLEWIFRGQCKWGKHKGNECLKIRGPDTRYRERIVIFAGGSKADSYKKIRGNSYGMWIATEINLHHEKTIEEAFNRQLAAKLRKIYWDFNPDNPNAPIYRDHVDKYIEKSERGELVGGCNYQKFTIFDNINISETRIAEIMSQYAPGSLWYRRDILGERCIAEGVIFDMFGEENLFDDTTAPEFNQYEYTRYIAVDYGTNNPCVFLDCRDDGDTVYVVDEYRWDSHSQEAMSSARSQKTDEEYGEAMAEFLDDDSCSIVIDPSAASFKVELRNRGFFVKDANNDVLNGIRAVSSMFGQGKLKLHKDKCAGTIAELRGYSWDDKAALRGIEQPVKQADHGADALRYGVYTMLPKWRYGQRE